MTLIKDERILNRTQYACRRLRCSLCFSSCGSDPPVLDSNDHGVSGEVEAPPPCAHLPSTQHFFTNSSGEIQHDVSGGSNISKKKKKKKKSKKKDREEKRPRRCFFYELRKMGMCRNTCGVARGHVELPIPPETPARTDKVAGARRLRQRHTTSAAVQISKSRTTSRTCSRKISSKLSGTCANSNKFERATWLPVSAATLAVLVFSGKAAAIAHLVLFFYVLSYLKKLRDSGGDGGGGAVYDSVVVSPRSPAAEMDEERESNSEKQQQQKVVMEGFLERKGRAVRMSAIW